MTVDGTSTNNMPKCTSRNLKIPIEIIVFLLFFAIMNTETVYKNLLIYRTCYVTLGYNKSECALLGSQKSDNQTAYLEKIVEPYVASIYMINTLVQNCFAAIVCLFIGPWSDRFGRKPIIIIPIMGSLLFYTLLSIFATTEDASPWFSLIFLLPVCLTGSTPAHLTGLFSYITDITDNNNRGFRMGIFEACLFSGAFFGNFLSSYIFTATSYATVFTLSAGCILMSLILTVYCIPESLPDIKSQVYCKGLFHIRNITQNAFRGILSYTKCWVLCCILVIILSEIAAIGNSTVTFLFLRKKFNWSLQKFTWLLAEISVIRVLCTVIGVYLFHNVLKISETVLALTAIISAFSGVLLMALAENDWMIYAAPVFGFFDGMFMPMLRSFISKIVPDEETGKVFGLVTASQYLFGMSGSPLYTMVYDSTIDSNLGIFFFISAGIYLCIILIIAGLIIVRTRSKSKPAYRMLEESDNDTLLPKENV